MKLVTRTAPARGPRVASLGAPVALLLLCCASRAQAADPEAQVLFDEGRRLLARGDIATACERFERSQKLEPAGGTLLHLARCREDQGRTATAWTLFNEALSVARGQGRKDREQVASEHLATLEPRLVRLRIVVPPAARVPQLTVTRDGKPLDPAGWGVAVPVDPGMHDVEASAPGRRTWKSKVEAQREGSTMDIDVPELSQGDGSAAPAGHAPADPPPASGADEGSAFGTQRTVALVVGGIGAVGLGFGTYFGLRSSSLHDETNALCGGPAPKDCPQAGTDKAADAQAAGNLSTVAFIVGGLGIAGGLVLWFTAPSRRDVAAAMMRGDLRVAF